jgi:oligopeptide transport system substrate-binding protein
MRRRIVAPIAFAVGATVTSLPAAAQADLNKVLRVVFAVAETGFDPQASNDVYSAYVERAIFDSPYTYDIVARPYTIIPNTAVALPEVSPDGLQWTLRIKPGIYFSDDPAFKGKKRELTAADYIYSWKRVLDPKMRSPVLQMACSRVRTRWWPRRRKPASSTTTRRCPDWKRSTGTRYG